MLVKVIEKRVRRGLRERSKRGVFASPTTYFGRNEKIIKELRKLPLPREPVVHIFGCGGLHKDFHPTEHLEVANALRGLKYRINVFDIEEKNLEAIKTRKIRLAVRDEVKEYLREFFPEIRKRYVERKKIDLAGEKKEVSIYEMELPEKLLPKKDGPIRVSACDIVTSAPIEKADVAICLNLHQSLLFSSEDEFLDYSKKVREIQAGESVKLVFNKGEIKELAHGLNRAKDYGAAALTNMLYGLKRNGFLITDLIVELKLRPSDFGLKKEKVIEKIPRTGFTGGLSSREINLYKLVDPSKLKKIVEKIGAPAGI